MSTVVKYKKIRFMILSNDHGAPHVHIQGKGGEAKVFIGNLEIESVHGFTKRDMNLFLTIITENRDALLAKWKEYHGEEK